MILGTFNKVLDILFLVHISYKAGNLTLSCIKSRNQSIDLCLAGGRKSNLGTFAQESLYNGLADTACTTCYENNFVFQFQIHK